MDEEGLLILAACLEGPSEHPLAAAIVEESRRRGLPITSVGGFTAVHGRGVRAALGDRTCMGGNRAMMEEAGVELGSFPARAEELAAQGKTPSTLPTSTGCLAWWLWPTPPSLPAPRR